MTETFSAAAQLTRLKEFQRRTVRHVVGRMYDDPAPARRFLVADETGLGKSVVARGVIAEAVERLLQDDNVSRIDVVYVCSNADIAAQNLSRLNVVGNNRVEFRTRLTMLAAQSHDLNQTSDELGKPVNLIAFTPATSFEKGWRTGKSEERALLAVMLEQLLDLRAYRRTALHRVLQGGVRTLERFRGLVQYHSTLELDSTIVHDFDSKFRSSGADREIEALLNDIGRRRSLSAEQLERSRALTGQMRHLLAQASVHALEPDLIILDEFQRFRHLLDPEAGSEAAELAHHLFDWGEARTLLLSATPYKPFTLAEEDEDGEDHYTDLMTTLGFLCAGEEEWLAAVRASFQDYRGRLLSGEDSADAAADLRARLLQFMCRTERPVVEGAHREFSTLADAVSAEDLMDFVGLRELATAVGGDVRVEYWKSTPYFANFLDGYQVGERLKTALKRDTPSPEVQAALRRVSQLDNDKLTRFEQVDMGNARLRTLAERTIGDGWWQLLWVPPSMPYLAPGGPYAEPFASRVTKQLIFSSWTATPTAIASLLSYEADRRVAKQSQRLAENTAEARRKLAIPLTYRATDGRAAAMSTLALFWPHPTLAAATDPLLCARETPSAPPTAQEAGAWAARQLGSSGATTSPQLHTDFFSWPGLLPSSLADHGPHALSQLIQEGAGSQEASDTTEATRLDLHVEEALRTEPARRPSADLAALALNGPGCIAWRALSRLVGDMDSVSEEGRWTAAASLANDLRSLFNRVESTLLLDQLYPETVYWRAVLAYCSDGNLQAVLDEYLHHVRSSLGDETLNDASLGQLAKDAGAVLSMRPSRYLAVDPNTDSTRIALNARFALRYGSARSQDEDSRLPEVRAAFNSPFWPFILTSTSTGQEGIDFHWWCHSVVHWNTPASPVDFEQREGRVNRFGGHAVRKNVAAAHRSDVMESTLQDPWQAAYEAASVVENELGDFSPYWVYPGAHAVERHLLPFPLSKDGPRVEALKRSLTHYRLALGQPRQEDFLALLKDRHVASAQPIDLTPPA